MCHGGHAGPQVPRSSAHISEDNDYSLVSVVLFKRVLDDFKAAARSKGYQVSSGIDWGKLCCGGVGEGNVRAKIRYWSLTRWY